MKRFLIIAALLAAAACTTRQAPLVGVSCSRYSSTTILPTTYTDAITRAGGVPVILPTIATREEADALLNRLDGLMFSGGEDVSPSWYGEEILNGTVEVDAIRDRSDSLLAAAALAARKPIFAICRGSQMLNVFLGGSLYQDIPSQLPDALCHSGDSTMHMIGLQPDSFLARVFGPDSLLVNSMHHQAVKDLAPGIMVTARSSDGMVEAWEAPGIVAVQFHPEKMLPRDGFWLPLFREWIRDVRTGSR